MGGSLESKFKSSREILDPGLAQREERADRVLYLLDKLDAHQHFDTLEHRAEFLAGISYDDLKRIGMLTNDLTRGRKMSREFDGRNVRVKQVHAMSGSSQVDYIPPDEQDKEELLSEILNSAKKLEPARAALLIASGINAVHPFTDGNGRASRLAYSLLSEGYDGSEAARERVAHLLGPEGRKYVDPNPKFVAWIMAQLIESENGISHGDSDPVESWSEVGAVAADLNPESLPLSTQTDDQTRQALLDIVQDQMFRTSVFYIFLKEENMLREPYLLHKESPGRYKEFGLPDTWTSIEIDEVLKSLTQEQIRKLLDVSRGVRKSSVRLLERFFTEPEEFKMKGGKTVEAYFAAKVEASKKKG